MLNRLSLCFSRQQAINALADEQSCCSIEEHFLLLLRAGRLAQAEAVLFTSRDCLKFRSELLLLRIYQRHQSALEGLLEIAPVRNDASGVYWYAKQTLLMWNSKYQEVVDLDLPKGSQPICLPWHRLLLASALLWLGRTQDAKLQLELMGKDFVSPEKSELQARLAIHAGKHSASLEILASLLDSGDASPLGWEMAIHSLNEVGQKATAQAMLQRARNLFPNSARLVGRDVVDSVNRRRPIHGRRLALLERLKVIKESWLELDRLRSHQNLAYAFENGGRPDLLCHLHLSILSERRSWEALGNHAMQMASLASPKAQNALLAAQESLFRPTNLRDSRFSLRPDNPNRLLRVGLVTPDVNYHPVCRFVLMQLMKSSRDDCEYHVIRTGGRTDWATDLVKTVAQMHGDWSDLSAKSSPDKLNIIRELRLDVAVDLAGWTGSSEPALFASRIAPLQVNYLGFFASTGLSEMDYWLGDSALFPDSMNEWSSESIWRLSRCFLAWEPFEQLPEGRVSVPAPPAAPDLVFGSFNHMRKLSDSTLCLWARILEAVPGSRLALKAYTSDDPGAATLLRRRMQRCGLDPERVIWLPTCASPEDHLRQYGLVDVALDPFPNGGCTTSCEALWMGVPVITLAGDRYVSRMSTAVLSGAELPEWIASSEEDYFNKALQAASQRQHLRQSREQLRQHLQASPLGDAAGLNASLAQAWQGMVEQKSQAEASA